jgi:cadmium resistance protein CadD (predicted permease)
MSIVAAIVIAVPLFAVTNIDDIFVLLGFFSDPRFRISEVLIGQYLGVLGIVAISIAAAVVAMAIPPRFVGLLGLAPIAMGIRKLYGLWNQVEDEDAISCSTGFDLANMVSVAAVTIVNGGDNIGVYTPVFAVHSVTEVGAMVAVFLVMTLAWCAVAFAMVRHPTVGAPLRRYGVRLLPLVLIAIGAIVLYQANTFGIF